MSDIDAIRAFVAVYRSGTVTAGAATSGVSQPAMSMQLARLESRLGVRLFDRTARGMSPTSAGHELARQAAAPLAAIDRILSPPQPSDPLTGLVRIAGPADLIAERLVPALANLAQRGVRLEFLPELGTGPLDLLVAGSADMAISTSRPADRAVEFQPLYDEKFLLVAAPRWALPRAAAAEVVRQRLADVPIVAFAPDLPLIRRFWRVAFRARISRTAAIVVPDLRAVRAAVVAGLGMTVLPDYLCAEALATRSLIELVRPTGHPFNTAYLAWTAGAAPVARIDAVRGTLAKAAQGWSQ
ncbi:MAG: LysR family transcriptional regulator [Actinomycetota bacterium]